MPGSRCISRRSTASTAITSPNPVSRASPARFAARLRSICVRAAGRRRPRARFSVGHAMSVAIIDYGSGNLHSARKAFERAAREAGVSHEIKVTARPEDVLAADHLVLPGVGAFADCRRGLDGVAGMVEAMEEAARKRGRPFLGICVGMQLLATRGLEHEVVAGLNWLPGDVAVIRPTDASLKIPHMGWNTLEVRRPHPLLEGVRPGLHAYFVHSYQLYARFPEDV